MLNKEDMVPQSLFFTTGSIEFWWILEEYAIYIQLT